MSPTLSRAVFLPAVPAPAPRDGGSYSAFDRRRGKNAGVVLMYSE